MSSPKQKKQKPEGSKLESEVKSATGRVIDPEEMMRRRNEIINRGLRTIKV